MDGNNVRKVREAKMLSKTELAGRAGISPLTVDRIERGMSSRITNRIRILIAIAVATLLAACTTTAPMPSGIPEYMLVGIDNKLVFGDDGRLPALRLNSPST
jgi:transcriptional regulator with XRE-family HTH domain